MTRRLPRHRASDLRSARYRRTVGALAQRGVAAAVIGSATVSGAPAHAAPVAPPPSTGPGPIQSIATADFRSQTISRDAAAVAERPAVAWPLGADAEITDHFGPRVAPKAGASTFHRGIDLVAHEGAPVRSALGGTVSLAQPHDSGGCGVQAEITHRHEGATVVTKYCHLEAGSLVVQTGQRVAAGDVIGRMGNTGVSTGPHLHFEVIVDGAHVDPLPWLAARAGR